jgi:CDP-glucose 4,6-dehydratase
LPDNHPEINLVNTFAKFYFEKNVFITGHTGFKGSWLTQWLLKLGANVTGYSLYLPSTPCNFNTLKLSQYIVNIEGDVRNFEQLYSAINECRPDIVFHLAAQPIVKRSYEDPKLTFDTNVGGTINILECLRQTKSAKAAVIITSDKCYKNEEWLWGYREGDRLGGDDPYSASKGCAELIINSYCKSFSPNSQDTRIASTRAGNVIGGGDWNIDRLIPDCVKAWSADKKVILRNPAATRPWQHVLEPLSGYLWLGALLGQQQIPTGEAFNFGPQADVIQPVGVVVNKFSRYWDKAIWTIGEAAANQKESMLLKLCCDKALQILDWQPILSFEEMIAATASWYRSYYENDRDMSLLTVNQIHNYTSLANRKGLKWAVTV